MKHRIYYLLALVICMASCSTDEKELFNSIDSTIYGNNSKSIVSDTLSQDCISPLVMTDELLTLNNDRKKL